MHFHAFSWDEVTYSNLGLLLPALQSLSGIPALLRRTQTCPRDGWGCEIHRARTTGTFPQAPLSGSLLHPWVKLGTPWCPPRCPWRLRPARNLRWGLTSILIWQRHWQVKLLLTVSLVTFFQESWAQLSSTNEGAGEGELWKVNHG